MKIGIDISQIVYETGVSTYTLNLVRNLLETDKANSYLLFGGALRKISNIKDKIAKIKGDYQLKTLPFPPTLADWIWNRLHILPIEIFTGRLDVFHSSDWSQPPSRTFKVTTIHDLSPLKFSKMLHSRIVAVHKKRLELVKKEVDRIIVPSKATKKDLIAYGFSQEKIRLIPEAADPIFKPAQKSQIKNLKRKYKIDKDYLLAVGVGERKNSQRIIEAFKEIKENHKLKLIILGNPYGKLKQDKDVIFIGHASFEEMPAFYSGAIALIYPSLYEGFGLPILEAFACHCPVVTSDVSSMPEVTGKAAVLVNPWQIGSIVLGIKEVLKNRDKYIKLGQKRLKKFSWQKTAQLTIKVYEEALKNL